MSAPFAKLTVLPLSLGLAAVIAAAGVSPSLGQTPATQPPAKAKAKSKGKAAAKLDLNRATAEEMIEELPGVGEVTARKIVEGRPYTTVDDLARAGVPARTIDGIRPLVTVGPAPAKAEARAKAKAKAKSAEARTAETVPPADAPRGKAAMTKSAAPAAAPAGGRVNVNTASEAELEALPGIGPVVAKAIIAGRPYKTVNDLENVRGLGPAKLAALRDLVSVAPAPAPVPAPTAPAAGTTASTKPATAPATVPAGANRPAMTKTATPPATAAAAAKTKGVRNPLGGLAPGQVVNINTASQEELELLPDIGPVRARAIIEARPFQTKEDIMKVTGIKEGIFARIRDLITVK